MCAETKDLKVGITPIMKMFEGTIDGKKITMLKLGYPADRIKWYRGGMQDWEILGLSIATP